jgi:lysine 6-dehydrogenase
MKTLIMGLGRQGFRILELMLEDGFESITVYDRSSKVIEQAQAQFGNRIHILERSPLGQDSPEVVLSSFDLLIDALPSVWSYPLLQAAVKAGIRAVSVSFLEEDFMILDADAKENGALIVPDCGAAPGFSHLMAGYSVCKMGGASRVVMKLGAIPKSPVPPFYHSLTWSVEDLMEEYVRPAKVRKNGQVATEDPFESVQEEEINGMKLQSFVSDGARSFLTSYPDVPEMEERTLRWHGHMEFMATIRDGGFLSHDPVHLESTAVIPIDFLAKVLEKEFGNLERDDMFIMEITVESAGGSHVHFYNMPYNSENDVFGLVNSVAVTAAETAAMIRDGVIRETGVKPLELLATETVFARMADAHRFHGATVELRSILP